MTPSVTPKRKKAKFFRWLLILLLLGTGAYAIYTRYFQNKLGSGQPVVTKEFSHQEEIAGRPFTITLYAASREQAEEAFQAALKKGREIQELTTDDASGDLARLNEAAAGQWRPLPHALYTIVAQGRELAEITGGAYDPALGALRKEWQAGIAERSLPSPDALAATKASSSWENIFLEPDTHSVRRNNEVVQVDIADIALGACLDQMMTALANLGIESALIASGSEVRASDAPPQEKGWSVVIPKPGEETPETFTVSQCGVSTARISTETVEIDGRETRIEINPRTAAAAARDVQATVVARNCLTAQALAQAAKFSPELVAGFSPSTDIHSRITTPGRIYLSKGFPPVTPLSGAPAKEEAAAQK